MKIKKFLASLWTLDNLIQISIAFLTISTGLLLAFKCKWAYVFGMLSQIPWWAFVIRKKHWGIGITNCFYAIINCIGFYNWFFVK